MWLKVGVDCVTFCTDVLVCKVSYHELSCISNSMSVLTIRAFITFQVILRVEFAAGHLWHVQTKFYDNVWNTTKFVKPFSTYIAFVSF